MERLTTHFGPEWNPVLLALAVLAVLCALAIVQWWLGVAGIIAAIVALLVVVYW